LFLGVGACQDYVFEARPANRSKATKITELVANIEPTDILFVIDNSGSMQEEIVELQNNIGLFIDEMAKSQTDFQVGIIAPDVECNLPRYVCTDTCPAQGNEAGCNDKPECGWNAAQSSCLLNWPLGSYACCVRQPTPICTDELDNEGHVIASTCDGGRLRASAQGRRLFARPAAGQEAAWVAEFKETIASLGTNGSSYEGGLEAMRRAVSCSAGVGCDAFDQAVADVNQGLIRAGANLVVIFVTDEDDCSMADRDAYAQPRPASDTAEQAAHLCWPNECYAYYGAANDLDQDGLMDWADPDQMTPAQGLLQCGPAGAKVARTVNPPSPRAVEEYLDALVAAKGGDITKVRAAGIVSAIAASDAVLGSEPAACVGTASGPSIDCGCLATGAGDQFMCAFTALIGQRGTPFPDPPSGGCSGLPGSRYVEFLQKLAARRQAALVNSNTLVDSICKSDYSQTMYQIVNDVILDPCVTLSSVPAVDTDLQVMLNGQLLAKVDVGAGTPGYSWVAGSAIVCLEGGLSKKIGDSFEIVILEE